MTEEDRREALKDICQIVKVEGIDSFKIISALDNVDFADFEDCLQEECAVAVSADYIVTRNAKDFVASRIPVILPDQFLEKYKDIMSIQRKKSYYPELAKGVKHFKEVVY